MKNLEIKNLSFGYSFELVLDNVNLMYDFSDFLAIIGPNGGGKSTLLKLILGILKPKSGSIRICDLTPAEYAKFIGYVPQNTNINPNFPLMAQDVVLMGSLSKNKFGFYNKKDRLSAMEALEKVEMQKFAKTRIDELSGGQRQRVFIARSLCANAKLLMMDEPTASIDTNGQLQIFELLSKLNKEELGIIVISHDTNIVLAYASKIAHINKNLHLHDMTSFENKQNIINSLANTNEHFCQIDLIQNKE